MSQRLVDAGHDLGRTAICLQSCSKSGEGCICASSSIKDRVNVKRSVNWVDTLVIAHGHFSADLSFAFTGHAHPNQPFLLQIIELARVLAFSVR